jgi:hypothetical protein
MAGCPTVAAVKAPALHGASRSSSSCPFRQCATNKACSVAALQDDDLSTVWARDGMGYTGSPAWADCNEPTAAPAPALPT